MVINLLRLNTDSTPSLRVTQGRRVNKENKESLENRLNRKLFWVNRLFNICARPLANVSSRVRIERFYKLTACFFTPCLIYPQHYPCF